jgi:hypothetical protein
MFEELKPAGIPQVAAVVNDAGSLYELDPAAQTVCTLKSYDVPSASPVRSLEVVARSLTVIHVDEDESFHWRL